MSLSLSPLYIYIYIYIIISDNSVLNVMFTCSHHNVTVSHYRDPLHVNILIVKKCFIDHCLDLTSCLAVAVLLNLIPTIFFILSIKLI